MSLLIHLPLHDGTLTNYGLSTSVAEMYNNVTPVFNSSGKIGLCLDTDSVRNSYVRIPNITLGSNVSIACWSKTTVSGKMMWGIQADNYGGYFNLYCANIYTLNVGDGNNNPFKDANGNTISVKADGAWHHYCVTFDGSSIKLYIDGSYAGTAITYRSPVCTNKYVCVGNWYYSSGTNVGYLWDGYINDFRVYDHTLSPLEVKKLSLGLVLHYLCSDTKFTTNLISSITAGGRMTQNGTYGMYSTYTGSDTYGYINTSSSLVDGKTYTLSFDVSGMPSGAYWNYSLWNDSDYTITINRNGRIVYTFTLDLTKLNSTELTHMIKFLFDDQGKSGMSTSDIVYYSNFKLEENSNTCPSINIDNIEYDSSGLKNNGTCTNITFSNDKIKYQGSYQFENASNYIYTTSTPLFTKNVTFMCWIKSSSTSSYAYLVSQGRDSTASGFNLMLDSKVPNVQGCFGMLSSNTTIDSNWHHIAGTYDGSLIKVYVDGELKNYMNYTSDLTYTYAPALVIGKMAYGYTNTSVYFPCLGNISDVRVYATALSADNIKEIYNERI